MPTVPTLMWCMQIIALTYYRLLIVMYKYVHIILHVSMCSMHSQLMFCLVDMVPTR